MLSRRYIVDFLEAHDVQYFEIGGHIFASNSLNRPQLDENYTDITTWPLKELKLWLGL